jgi:hypothetical protein
VQRRLPTCLPNYITPLCPCSQVERAHSLCRRLEAGLPPNPVAAALRAGVSNWQLALPAVTALRNADLRERHWGAIGELLGAGLEKREEKALSDVLAIGVSLASGAGVCRRQLPLPFLRGWSR